MLFCPHTHVCPGAAGSTWLGGEDIPSSPIHGQLQAQHPTARYKALQEWVLCSSTWGCQTRWQQQQQLNPRDWHGVNPRSPLQQRELSLLKTPHAHVLDFHCIACSASTRASFHQEGKCTQEKGLTTAPAGPAHQYLRDRSPSPLRFTFHHVGFDAHRGGEGQVSSQNEEPYGK